MLSTAKKFRPSEELLAKAQPDGAADRVEQVRLVGEGHLPEGVAHLRPAVEQIVDRQRHAGTAEERDPADQVALLAEVGEQAQIDGGGRREEQIAVIAAGHGRAAAPIGAEEAAEAVAEQARAKLDLMLRPAAAAARRRTAEEVEFRSALADQNPVLEPPGVEQAELDPALAAFRLDAESPRSSSRAARL